MSIISQARDIIKNLQTGANNIGQGFSDFGTQVHNFTQPPVFASTFRSPTPEAQRTIRVSTYSPPPPTPQPTAVPQIIQQVIQPNNQWQSKFQPLYDKVLPQKKLNKSDEQVLVTSENGKEDPGFQNTNYDKYGKPVSVDTGLLQVNTPLDSPEISRLKDPEYNINKGLGILQQRVAILGDPVLAVASYNKGAGGAVLDPVGSLNRAKKIYANAGVPLPDTPFTRDPKGYVAQNMESYRKYGLFK